LIRLGPIKDHALTWMIRCQTVRGISLIACGDGGKRGCIISVAELPAGVPGRVVTGFAFRDGRPQPGLPLRMPGDIFFDRGLFGKIRVAVTCGPDRRAGLNECDNRIEVRGGTSVYAT
jgi:hypothetical protein